jgi:hypothetical protein
MITCHIGIEKRYLNKQVFLRKKPATTITGITRLIYLKHFG